MPPIFFTIWANFLYWARSSFTSLVDTPAPRATLWMRPVCLVNNLSPSKLSNSVIKKIYIPYSKLTKFICLFSLLIYSLLKSIYLYLKLIIFSFQQSFKTNASDASYIVHVHVWTPTFFPLTKHWKPAWSSYSHVTCTYRQMHNDLFLCVGTKWPSPLSFMLSIIVISFFRWAIDSCSPPLVRKSELNPGIIPCEESRSTLNVLLYKNFMYCFIYLIYLI